MKRFEIFFGIIRAPLDFIMTVLAFLAAYQLRLFTDKPIDYSVLPTINEYLNFSIYVGIALVVVFALGKMYSLKITYRFSQESRKTLVLCGIWAMAIITYFFFSRTFPFSRLAILYSWTLTFIFLILGRAVIRLIQKIFLKMGLGKRRVAFIGEGKITQEIHETLAKDSSYKIISIKSLEDLKKKNVDEIIQTKSLSEVENEDLLEFCELHHINYRFIPDLVEVRRTNIFVEQIRGIPIISLKPTPLEGWGRVIKRVSDIVGATLGLVILSPVFLITAVTIKFDSRGPVFFTKLDDGSPVKRVGQYGHLFKFYKFRSMHPGTDKQRYKHLAKSNTRNDGPLVKIANDPRVTKVGSFIRRYSIDELPQLWNVLIGHMSLVGPRPHLPEEVKKYQKHHRFVLTIKPGLSGLAQISGRSHLGFEEEVKLDRYYIENWSIWKDVKIVFKTIGVVLKGYKE